MTRVHSGGLARNPFGATQAQGKPRAPETLGQQIEQELFGKKPPPLCDSDDADSSALLARLVAYKRKLVPLAGDVDEDYQLRLAQGPTIAMIDGSGVIYLGRDFLLATSSDVALQVGVLAHEIGHRPKRWRQLRAERAQQQAPTTRAELAKLCRHEETQADFFAGRALAELSLPCEPLVAFLLALDDGVVRPHPEYFPPKLRGEVIREGFNDGQRQASQRKALFPELHKRTNPKTDLGVG
jgi:hypothetical protein